ncbi:MAG TPA: CHC2 zinc finger domain-containing protein [Gemmataceae bacterium]|nr:CHC2 zinc finger domain-containing protein [Gemmataceae bacterium]
MPGVNSDRLRAEITMVQVLDLLAFEPVSRAGPQWYGCCPLHEPTSKRSRAFSVNLAFGRYYWHRCHRHGNQPELWAAASKLPLHRAAIDLCRRLGREVSRVHCW